MRAFSRIYVPLLDVLEAGTSLAVSPRDVVAPVVSWFFRDAHEKRENQRHLKSVWVSLPWRARLP